MVICIIVAAAIIGVSFITWADWRAGRDLYGSWHNGHFCYMIDDEWICTSVMVNRRPYDPGVES